MANYVVTDCRRKPRVAIAIGRGIGGLRDIGRRFTSPGFVQRILQVWS